MANNNPDSLGTSTDTLSNTDVSVLLSPLSRFTQDEERTLRIMAMTFASLSVLAGGVMFCWYLTLQKRTFRHTYYPLRGFMLILG